MALLSATLALLAAFGPSEREPAYPYGSPAFARFVADSYETNGGGDPNAFFRWFEGAYHASKAKRADKPALGLRELLAWDRARLARIRDPKLRAKEETKLGRWMHRMVKTVIPRFSLDRGFEFTNTAKLGERQCFLQGVLIAGMLQSAGVGSGVAMVWKNPKGQETNNGHAVAVARLGDGTDLIVDASHPEPFPRQQGLFVADGAGGYRFARPVYAGATPFIRSYRAVTGAFRARMLDIPFLRSQFDYYRGERAPGGFMAAKKTPAGLAASARFLERAVRTCPKNPLPVYVLGLVYTRLGKMPLAKAQIARGYALYQRFGLVPGGPREAYARVAGKAVGQKR